MELEEQSSHEGMKTPKWTWSSLYGPIHKDNSCPDFNARVAHVSKHAIDGIPSLSIAQQYTQQVVRHKYNHGWVDCDSTLQMLATCIVRTTRAIWQASENASDHTHLMNHHRFSPELWKGAVRELINIDSILLPSLPRSKIVVYNNNVVVSTPHRLITINVKTRSTPELSLECPEISVRWNLASATRRGVLHPCQVFVPDFRMWK